jgi:4-carboxymuconolactone decarboxylase
MQHIINWPLEAANPETFKGAAYMRLVAAATSLEPIKAYYVRFEPGARTNWHSHSGDQVLVVTAGNCRYQLEGDAVSDLKAGESVRIPAGVRHWHGAGPGSVGEHLAVNIDARETSWLDPVSDEEYDPPA